MAVSGGMITDGWIKEARISAVVTRADGSVENLGELAYWHRNPVMRLVHSILKLFKGN